MCKASILYQLEHGGLNPEWLMLNLLAQMSEEQARWFCTQHDLHVTPEPTRTVEEAIEDLYERRMAALFDDDPDPYAGSEWAGTALLGDEDPDPYAGSEWAGGREG